MTISTKSCLDFDWDYAEFVDQLGENFVTVPSGP